MSRWPFTKGLHDLGDGVYAYLQPDGSWGWSNAGLVVGDGRSLLVDTLFDLRLTREMLEEMRRAVPAAGAIEVLVNTHSNGDHCNGNELVEGAEIVASRDCAEEMRAAPRGMLASLMKTAPEMGELGAYFSRCFSAFHFDDINPAFPTRTFEGRLDLRVGHKDVQLLEVGPCHTRGDVIVHVPEARALFAGDILFVGGTPIMWAGPVANWIGACDLILGLNADKIVPGHGPVTGPEGVRAVRGYFEYIAAEARRRYDAGMPAPDAAADIALGPYGAWTDRERIAVNVHILYREFSGDASPVNHVALFEEMAKYAKRLNKKE